MIKNKFWRYFSKNLQAFPTIEYILRRSFCYPYIWYRLNYIKPYGKKGKKILYVNQIGDQDLEALLLANHSHVIRTVHFSKIFYIAKYFFPPAFRKQIIPYNSKEFETSQKKYRKVMKLVVTQMTRYYSFDACMVQSDLPWWIREFILELRSRKIPVIVLEREGIVTKYFLKRYSEGEQQRYPFIGDFYLIWNEIRKTYLIKSGVNEKKIKVVGHPRSDFFFHPERWQSKKDLGYSSDKPLVLLFTYGNHFDMADILELWKKPGFDINLLGECSMRQDTHNVFIELARENPDWTLVIKSHPGQKDKFELEMEFKKENLPNLDFVIGYRNTSQLIVNADIVIGHQTTALIETMLLEKPILFTHWGISADYYEEYLFPFKDCKALETIKSPEILKKRIREIIFQKEKISLLMVEERKKFVNNYFFQPNGKVCQRALENTDIFLNQKQ